jgi:hypothetical protein
VNRFAATPLLVVLAAAALLALAATASAHRNPCHQAHTCPSDHHTYPWNGLWCTSYADERLATDTKTVSWDSRTYWCHGTRTQPPQTPAADPDASGGGSCGIERWTVKTLQDRPNMLPIRTVSLRYLVTRPAPASLPSTRLPFERHVYRVVAAVTEIRPEDDGDYHLILRDHGLSMIAETPALSCTSRARLPMRLKMQAARKAARVCARAAVTGVAFFDYHHGQTGVAPNAIELHPVLRFECLSR